jgi:hypothetical protein
VVVEPVVVELVVDTMVKPLVERVVGELLSRILVLVVVPLMDFSFQTMEPLSKYNEKRVKYSFHFLFN